MVALEEDQASFETLVAIVRRLRDPDGGCPWDLEQTHESLRETLLEETYEALDAVASGSTPELVEELGDLLVQVVFHAQIGADEGTFTIGDVVRQLNQKLIRRHPHVFGEASARSATEAIGQWERLKAQERQDKGQGERSMLAGVSKSMPALAYAQAILERAARAGLQPSADGGTVGALQAAVADVGGGTSRGERERALGELLFAAAAYARAEGLQAEEALRGANRRFYERFERMEAAARRQGLTLAEAGEEQRAALWREAAF